MASYKWTPKEPIQPQQQLGHHVTVGRAAELLDVNPSRVRQMINEGKLEAVALGDNETSVRPFFMIDLADITIFNETPKPAKKRGPQPGHGGRPRRDNTTDNDSSTWNIVGDIAQNVAGEKTQPKTSRARKVTS